MELSTDFSQCRLCLCIGRNFVHIFNVNDETNYKVADLISDLLQLQARQLDGYPPFVCSTCFRKLTEFKIFKEQCIACKSSYDDDYFKREITVEEPNILEIMHRPIKLEEVMCAQYITVNQPLSTKEDFPMEDRSDASSENLIAHSLVSCGSSPIGKLDLICAECGQKRSNKIDMREHVMGHMGAKPHGSNIREQMQSKERRAEEEKKEKKMIYKCHDCGIECIRKGDLTQHVKIHGTEKPFMCSTCGKRFLLKKYLSRHQKTHVKEKFFECNECGKKFLVRQYLVNHMLVHTGRDQYKCASCDKSFKRKYELNDHQSTHDGERLWECEQCKKGFDKFKDLMDHCKSHLGETKFRCDVCGQKFSFKSYLRVHIMRHMSIKPHECHFCGKRFVQSYGLSLHLRVHTRERLSSCNICGKTFQQKHNLVTHKRTHTYINKDNK